MNTLEVLNQPPALENYNALLTDPVMIEGLRREGAEWAEPELSCFGQSTGSAEWMEWGRLANKFSPELKAFDRFGHRIDEVEFHPAYHQLMAAGVAAKVHCWPWIENRAGAHVARVVAHYLLSQTEAGVGCPLTMTFAGVPALRGTPKLAEEWVPRLTSTSYDRLLKPPQEKAGCLMGMAMTEKQGGSDVRANTTQAVSDGDGAYRLVGHKWFCSAPMCDVFLTLAQTEKGLSCFLVPRILPDGSRNRFHLQRLKDKLGNRSNASSEIEYHGAWCQLVGELGRGVPTIIEMVNHTRLDCVIGSAAVMRAALVQAVHHTRHRSAFGARLWEQPLMRQVLADLTLEWEAATLLLLRLARGYDQSSRPEEAAFVRLATAVAKYWVCKRGPAMVVEAMESLGGAGYVEESVLPRLYREAPLPSIWEGSGNVMCLDVLRAIAKSPQTVELFFAELRLAQGQHAAFDRLVGELETMVRQPDEAQARRLTEGLALALQASLLLRHSPQSGAAFCAARLDAGRGLVYGSWPAGMPVDAILARAWADS